MRWSSQTGSSLIELLVGGAIALIAMGALISLQISAYRAQKSDEDRFVLQVESATGLDRLTRELRMASSVSFTAGGSTATLIVGPPTGGVPVTYSLQDDTGEVIRTENGVGQVVGRQVSQLVFNREGTGRTILIEWVGQLPDGSLYRLESRAAPRVNNTSSTSS